MAKNSKILEKISQIDTREKKKKKFPKNSQKFPFVLKNDKNCQKKFHSIVV
jgi:hypothetical protein